MAMTTEKPNRPTGDGWVISTPTEMAEWFDESQPTLHANISDWGKDLLAARSIAEVEDIPVGEALIRLGYTTLQVADWQAWAASQRRAVRVLGFAVDAAPDATSDLDAAVARRLAEWEAQEKREQAGFEESERKRLSTSVSRLVSAAVSGVTSRWKDARGITGRENPERPSRTAAGRREYRARKAVEAGKFATVDEALAVTPVRPRPRPRR